MKSARFTDTAIVFEDYPYPGALVYPSGSIAYADIESVDPAAAPPELRHRSGEILFIPATQRQALETVAQNRGLPVRRRTDIWALILEPFLDTEFDAAHKERTFAQLEENGVSRAETDSLRRSLRTRMLAYNTIHWEWIHLGLADALDAHLSRPLPAWMPFAQRRFRRFYHRAMELASRGASTDAQQPADA
jgi:hypothetical protein